MAAIDPAEFVLMDVKAARDAGCVVLRDLGDGRMVGVCQLLTSGRIAIGPIDSDEWEDLWDYATLQAALDAWSRWDPATEPEPANWIRHPGSHRRRPDGDASREVIAP